MVSGFSGGFADLLSFMKMSLPSNGSMDASSAKFPKSTAVRFFPPQPPVRLKCILDW